MLMVLPIRGNPDACGHVPLDRGEAACATAARDSPVLRTAFVTD